MIFSASQVYRAFFGQLKASDKVYEFFFFFVFPCFFLSSLSLLNQFLFFFSFGLKPREWAVTDFTTPFLLLLFSITDVFCKRGCACGGLLTDFLWAPLLLSNAFTTYGFVAGRRLCCCCRNFREVFCGVDTFPSLLVSYFS